MVKITKTEASMIRSIHTEPGWNVIVRMLGQRIEELGARAGSVQGETEFQTLRALHRAQGGIEELKQFFEDLERGAFE
jgi:hypothetical protein